jgi:hypothetical protein
VIIHCKETLGDGTVRYKDYEVPDPVDPEAEQEQAEAITRYSNELTGNEDRTLAEATETLIKIVKGVAQ